MNEFALRNKDSNRCNIWEAQAASKQQRTGQHFLHNAALTAMSGLPYIGRLVARGFASSASASSAASHGSADASTLIRNVWCLGRSYAEHIRELDNAGPGGTIPQGPPMIFLKAGSSCLPSGQPLLLPKWSSDVHHEVELALQLGPDLRPVRGAVALDLTLRDVQVRQGMHACKHGIEHAHAHMTSSRCARGQLCWRYSRGLEHQGVAVLSVTGMASSFTPQQHRCTSPL